jgi:MFS family permease
VALSDTAAGAPATAASGASPWRRAALVGPMLSSGCLLAMMYTLVAPVLPHMAAVAGGGADATLLIQLFMTMPSLGMMAGGVLCALLVGRWGARRLFLVALAGYGVAGALGGLLAQAPLLLASRFILGLAAAGIATCATTLIGERIEAALRPRLIGYQSALGGFAGLGSTLLSGVVAERVGWHAPFAFYLAAWAVALVALFGIPAARTALPRRQASRDAVPETLPWRSLLPLYLLCVPLYAAIFMTSTQVPFLLQADHVTSPSVQASVLAMAALFNAVGAALYGRVRERLGARTFALSLALMALGQGVLGVSHQALLSGFGCAVAGLGAGLAVPHVPTLVMGRVDGAARGRALGLMYSALFLGSFCNPLFVAPLAAWIGRHGAISTSAALLALAAVFTLLSARQTRSSANVERSA